MDRFFDCLRLLAAICLLLDSLIKTSLGLIPLTAKYEDMLFQFFNLKSASLSLQDASRAARIDTTTMPIGLITYMIVLPWSVLFFLNRCYLGNVVIHRHHTTTHDKGSFIYYVRNPLPPPRPLPPWSLSVLSRCGRVMADNIAYAKFRKTLLI